MNIEEVLKLYDSYWFEMEFFKKQTDSLIVFDSSTTENIIRTQSLIVSDPPPLVRSISDDLSSRTSFSSASLSPDSVFFSSKLKKIVSGKEIAETEPEPERGLQKSNAGNRAKTKKRLSKSYSELEFEELKGFKDLGFDFSEENQDSRLVELVPGLQRLRKGKEDGEEQQMRHTKTTISRPYLSEAWHVLERGRRKEKNRSVDWSVFTDSELRDEVNIKNNLRSWAHTVASNVG